MDILPGTELTIIIEGTGASFKSFLVGEKKESQIVVGLPGKLDFSLDAFQKGGSVLVRYSDEENIYEFRTRILKTVQDPADLIVLEYPAGITTIEKRSRRRINCLMEAKLEIIFEDNNRLITGIIENISKTGCGCVIKKMPDTGSLFSLGDVINLRCQFPGLAGEQTAEGTIIRLQDLPEEVHAGIQFDKELWWVPPYDPERKG